MPDYQPHLNSGLFSRSSWRTSPPHISSKIVSATKHSSAPPSTEFNDDSQFQNSAYYQNNPPEYINMPQPPHHSSQHSPIKSSQPRTNSTSPGERHRPPVASVLTKANSFDSMLTNTVGHSPKPPPRAPSTHSNHPAPSSSSRPVHPQLAPPYPMGGSRYEASYPPYPPGPPPMSGSFHELYYPHHVLHPPEPFRSPHYNNHPYHQHHPYVPHWHHRLHDPSSSSLHPVMIVSSSSNIPAPPPAVVEYVTELGPHDVLSGRGGATNSYRGNRAFRTLVKEYQEQYLRAKKRDKPAVASLIVEAIRQRGGRFLRRESIPHRRHSADGNSNSAGGSTIQWVDIGDDRAREKTCQALREGAPELRRQGKDEDGEDGHRWSTSRHPYNVTHSRSFSFEDEDATSQGKDSPSSEAKNSRSTSKDGTFRTAATTIYRQSKRDAPHRNVPIDSYDFEDADDHTPEVRNGDRSLPRRISKSNHPMDLSICIRPWARLLPDRLIEPILLTDLSVQDRDCYLRYFSPPRDEWKEARFPHPQKMTFSEDCKQEIDPKDLIHHKESFSLDFDSPVNH
jgi:hypothetical protein